MDALTSTLLNQLSGDGLAKISKQIGADEKKTGSALSMALPLLVSALAKNSAKPEGAQALANAITKDHDGSVLDNLTGFLGNPQAANGAGILKHVLGAQQPVVTQGLSKSTGLDSSQIGNLLQIAAPLLMGQLGKQAQKPGFDVSSLASFLGNQSSAAQKSNPSMMSMLNNMLDSNKNGSAVDEVVGLLGKFLKKKK